MNRHGTLKRLRRISWIFQGILVVLLYLINHLCGHFYWHNTTFKILWTFPWPFVHWWIKAMHYLGLYSWTHWTTFQWKCQTSKSWCSSNWFEKNNLLLFQLLYLVSETSFQYVLSGILSLVVFFLWAQSTAYKKAGSKIRKENNAFRENRDHHFKLLSDEVRRIYPETYQTYETSRWCY